ncbi:uncharacterized protein RHOBADRAFT_66260, partial [Rhodotorula graminis WP1]
SHHQHSTTLHHVVQLCFRTRREQPGHRRGLDQGPVGPGRRLAGRRPRDERLGEQHEGRHFVPAERQQRVPRQRRGRRQHQDRQRVGQVQRRRLERRHLGRPVSARSLRPGFPFGSRRQTV